MPNSPAVIGAPTVHDVVEDASLQALTAEGAISITDSNAGQAFFKTSVIASSGDLGSLSIAANGSYVYSVADSKVQYLGAGETKVDTFTVTSLDGTTKQVAFTIIGVNDTAVIGVPTVVDVTEDAASPTLTATGSISITDADHGQAAFKSTVSSAPGNLGALVLQSNGSYTYSVANNAVQYLGAGQIKTDTFTVTSLDGTTKQISFNVHGTNDVAVIGTPTQHDVTEDASSPTLSTTGSISITDADQGQASFRTAVVGASGNLGTLVLAANGTYTYSVADAAVRYLGAGDVKNDTFTVTSLDGTQKQVSFTIHGVNDAAVIGVPTVHDVTEDASHPLLTAVGTISISDADQGQSAFRPTVLSGNGDLGVLVLSGSGSYVYSVADSAVQYLGAGDTKVDTFTVTALDGTTKQISFTIHGTNDAAVIGTPTQHDVTEDASNPTLTAHGTIAISDVDQGQAAFRTTVTSAPGTLGTLVLGANGAYTYSVADGAVQYLGKGDTKVDTFTVTSLDGTQKQVSFTIHGVNDAAAIGTPTVHDVFSNTAATTLTATGSIFISDVDQGEAAFSTKVIAATGTSGHLTLAADGGYTYSVAESVAQHLGATGTKVDVFTVTSLDGTQKQVSFTIHGASNALSAPIDSDAAANTIVEGAAAGSKVGITASVAGASSVTYSLSADSSGGGFAVDATTGVVTVADPTKIDYETAAGHAYSVTVQASDGHGGTSSQAFAIAIADAPPTTPADADAASANSVVEGAPAGTYAGVTASATDVNGPGVTYSLIGDTSGGGFTIDPATGAVTVADPTKIDYESAPNHAYSVVVQASDGTLTSHQTFVIGVTDAAPSIPVDSNAATNTVAEGAAAGTTVGVTASSTDVNGPAVVYSLIADSSGGGFTINAATGVVTVADATKMDYESAQGHAYSVTVQASDGTLTSHQTFAIGVTDVAPSTPVDSNTAANTVVEGAAAGSAVGVTASSTDVNGPALIYSLIGDTSGGGFVVNAATGVVTVADPSKIVFDAAHPSFDVTVDASDGTLHSQQILTIGVTQANHVPVAANDTGSITEDQVGTFAVLANDTLDPDQGAPNNVTIGAISNLVAPSGAHIGAADIGLGVDASNEVVVTLGSDFQHLQAGETATFDVAYILHGNQAGDTSTAALHVTVTGSQDAPTLQVTDASGSDDAPIPLSISAQLVDDGGTLSVVSISGIPASYTLNHGTFFDSDGHWEVAASDLAGLALVPGAQAHADTLHLQVSVASIEGGHPAVATSGITVDVTAGAGDTSNRAVDGYIAGAFVFADADGNGVYTPGEASATTNADGSFTLHDPVGTLIMTGGTDVSTGLAFAGTLKAPEGSTVVTPLTTLVTSVIASAAASGTQISATDAAAQVATAFGIDPTKVDLTTYDPVPAAVGGDPIATSVLSAGVQVQSTVAQISAVGATSSVFDAIAGAITNAGAGPIDLSAGSTVAAIVSDSGVTGDAATLVTGTVTAAVGSIQQAPDVTAIAQAGQVAQGSATASLAAITDFSDTSQTGAVTSTYVDHLADQVQAAVVADPTVAPIQGTAGNDVLVGGAGIDTIDGREGNDQISGGAGADQLFGGAGNDRIAGNAGNDHIDGGAGFDRALYTDATGGITVNMAAGTASGAGVDSDVLVNVEGVVGSAFDDVYDARGFTGSSGTPGTPIGYNEFEGGAGNDTVYGTVNAQGAALTRVSYVSATAGVTVDIKAGTADGDASVGHDTFVGPGIQSVWGSAYNDTILGSDNGFGTAEVFAGFAGNDLIDGRGGFDRADYNADPTTTSGITVNMAAGIVTGDASIGTDTLRSIEAVRGTNFADHYDATGFSGTSTNAGSSGTFNEFTGNGGDDVIVGNGATRLGFNNATAGVTVDFVAGTADGDASVGHDVFTGVNAVQASMFDDTLRGGATNDTFTGLAGNDYIDGRGGFDVSSYNNIFFTTGGVTVNMAAGTATGDASIGSDTLRSIEGIQGTNFVDHYDATGYGAAGALNVGNNGTFNQFEGLGGDDVIVGNGNTRLIYTNAAAAVTVDLSLGTAHGTAAGDAANIGTDSFTGVFSVIGSAFGDALIGSAHSDMFVGGGGNDSIDGGAGGDVTIYSGTLAQYTITTNAGQTTVSDHVAGRDGTDTLVNVEALQFTNANVLIASGSAANPVDLSDTRLFFNGQPNVLTTMTGSADDYVKINQGLSGHLIDLGAGGNDTVILGVTGGYNLTLANVEHVVGTAGDDFIGLNTDVNRLSIDMGAGNDTINLANGVNSVSETNTENLNGSDWSGAASNDTLTLLNDVSGLSVNLAQGTNTLNLAAGANSLLIVSNIDTINGTSSADALTISNGAYTPNNDLSIDLGAGDDALTVGSQYGSFALHNVEHLVVSGQQDAFYSLTNDQTGLSVDLGAGNTGLQIASGANTLALTHVQSVGTSDYVGLGGTSSPSDDRLTLTNDVAGLTVNLQLGDNTLNLAAGTNSITAYNVQHVNGSASDDVLTMIDAGGSAVDLGAGNDTLNLVGPASVTVTNVEQVNGSAFTDFITDATVVGTTTITGGGGSDFITAGAATDVIRYTDASESSSATGMDAVTNFDATQDQFLLDGAAGAAGAIHFMASGVLDGTPATPHGEAILVDVGGQQQLQIDVNGDGVIGAGDITVVMNGLAGTLSDANFAVITPNHAPTDIALGPIVPALVPENSAPGSLVGLLSDTDPDAGDTANYVLTDDAGGLFAISNGNQIVTTAPLDFEQAASHQVTVQVTDHAGATFSKNFQIDVTNVNEAPTDITLSNHAVAENAPGFTVVGNLSAVDPDAGGTATYTLVDDAGGLFTLVANQLVTTGPLDYEQAASHQITVRATDGGGLTVDKTFTIATTNVNEAPTAVLLSNTSVAENSAADTVVGALSALDPDAGDTATFTLTNDAGGLFAILNGNLVTTAPLNFEQATSHQVTVRVTDGGGLTHGSNFTIATTNVNEAPTDILLSNAVIPQGTANGTVVGTLSAVDPDAGDTATVTLLDDAGGQFSVSGGNLVVAGPLTAGTEQVTVHATDAGGLAFDKTIAITVNAGALVTGTAGPDTLVGTTGDDTIQGFGGNDRLQGLAGNDILDGGQGFDRAVYTDAASGITANLAAGTVTGGSGSDTLVHVEGVVGSDFADTFDATGFTGDAGVAGTQIGFNEFEGRGGNDSITGAVNSQGALLTRISYVSATGSVTVDLQAHTATGDSSVGTDTLVGSGFGGVIGSAGADTLLGSNNANGTVEIFDGRGGNDLINGRGGFDRADYSQDPTTTSGITVNMAAGTVTGDSTVGTDTLRSVESVRGTNFADHYDATGFAGNSTNAGSNGTFNEFVGMGGDDVIVGNGNTRLSYINATGGVTVDMQTGATPGTGTADGDASTGHDTFSGVNAVQGSMFDDVLRGSGNTASTETFYGGAGNDLIDGRGGFDLATYNNIYFSTGAVSVNMGAGTVDGDASTGHDTLRSIEAVQGTNFNDVYDASTFGTGAALNIGNNGTFNQFEGLGGNDTITGNGNTRIIYSSATAGVTIHLAAGTATGDSSVGTDTFTAVNSSTGSQLADTYDASGFVDAGTFTSGTFNLFEGLGGNDTITGNGSTRIAYTQAASGVSVDLSVGNAHSIAASDGAGIGIDTILGGVNSVQGSNFADTITGGSANEFLFGGSGADTISGGGGNDTLTGQSGNDTLDGGTGTDMASFTGTMAQYAVTTNGSTGVTTVADNVAGRDGTDTLTNVEVLQFSDATVLLTAGTAANPVDVSAYNLLPGKIVGTAGDDFLAVGGNVFGHQIDLGAGDDTVSLASPNFYQLNLLNVEHVTGSTGDDNVNLVSNAAGLTVDLGAGTDDMTLAGGVNSLSVTNVEILTSNDFSGPAVDDTLTLLNNAGGGMNVNLAEGDNTLNLAAGSNTFAYLFNIQHVHGTASDDVLTVTGGIYTPDNNPTVDLGGGDNTLNLSGGSLTALNIQHIGGDANDNFVTFNNELSGVAIDLGAGNDHVTLANGANSVSLTNVESVSASDFTGGLSPSDDTLTLLNDVTGVSVNLGDGTNTINLAAGTNSFDNLFGINQVNGASSSDVLTVTQQSFATVFDMAGGTINFNDTTNGVTVANASTVNGSAADDNITVANASGTTTVTGGLGADYLTAGAGSFNFNFNGPADSAVGHGDTIVNFDAGRDNFTFTGVNAATAIHYVDTAEFDGTVGSPYCEARVDGTGPNALLQIDLDGDGKMGAGDIEVHLQNYVGTLADHNFLLA
ncbi:VCBS domain-containing protein [Bradyrhizobium cytisi]|uniref:Cadherin domain-containing protein n=1 Tax=Bradyrhizobium cytisi TaxID=515489 RepID=A0A5S4WS29_9BRAD|nr:VCBS domain-containing protein [Bradyrhizobium cytisi]TYL84331.1 hypothetical protein FXB38_15935 [Bradyrhizobium cytisi]